MKSVPNPLRFLVFAAGLAGGTAAAEDIPKELLAQDYANCMQGCLQGNEKPVCDILCSCAVHRFQTDLDFTAYNLLSAEMARGDISPDNQAFLDETGTICAAELDRALGILDQQ
jgi:hypothetical protein